MKNASVFTFCLAVGLLIVSAGTANYIGLIASILLIGYSTAVCVRLEPEGRR